MFRASVNFFLNYEICILGFYFCLPKKKRLYFYFSTRKWCLKPSHSLPMKCLKNPINQ